MDITVLKKMTQRKYAFLIGEWIHNGTAQFSTQTNPYFCILAISQGTEI